MHPWPTNPSNSLPHPHLPLLRYGAAMSLPYFPMAAASAAATPAIASSIALNIFVVVSFYAANFYLQNVNIFAAAGIKVGIPPAFPHQWLIVVSCFYTVPLHFIHRCIRHSLPSSPPPPRPQPPRPPRIIFRGFRRWRPTYGHLNRSIDGGFPDQRCSPSWVWAMWGLEGWGRCRSTPVSSARSGCVDVSSSASSSP